MEREGPEAATTPLGLWTGKGPVPASAEFFRSAGSEGQPEPRFEEENSLSQ